MKGEEGTEGPKGEGTGKPKWKGKGKGKRGHKGYEKGKGQMSTNRAEPYTTAYEAGASAQHQRSMDMAELFLKNMRKD